MRRDTLKFPLEGEEPGQELRELLSEGTGEER
jgi:hypothetical protein